MSIPQYLRKVSLIIGTAGGDALELSALRVRFVVRRGDLQTPNSATIRIYNVSDETAYRIQKEFTNVVLQAGYGGNFGIIFSGLVKQVRRGRETPTDTFIDITAADGDSAYNFAVISASLVAGSTPADHIKAGVTAMGPYGVTQGYLPDGMAVNGLPRGKVMYGMVRDHLRNVARTMQCAWSIQDGKAVFIPLSAYMPGDVPVITRETGMVGLPEQTQNGIKVKALLNPSLKIGTTVKLDNASIQRYEYSLSINKGSVQTNFLAQQSAKLADDGIYYVMIAEHSGDTRGNEWYTELICLAVDATIPDGLITKFGVGPPGPVKPYG